MNRRLVPISLVISTILLAAACTMPMPLGERDAENMPTNANYFVLVQPDETALNAVTTDGENTYLTFDIAVPAAMRFFDGSGAELKSVRMGETAAIAGLHEGILMRLAEATSFVSVRPGATGRAPPITTPTADMAQLRERLVTEGPAREAMQAALLAVDARSDPNATQRSGDSNSSTMAVPVDWRAPAPPTLPASQMREGTDEGYIAFVPSALQPVGAVPVVTQVKRRADRGPGKLLISGITGPDANDEAIEIARRRAQVVRSILIGEGVNADRLAVTAVLRSDVHARTDPGRPRDTVNLRFLPIP